MSATDWNTPPVNLKCLLISSSFLRRQFFFAVAFLHVDSATYISTYGLPLASSSSPRATAAVLRIDSKAWGKKGGGEGRKRRKWSSQSPASSLSLGQHAGTVRLVCVRLR